MQTPLRIVPRANLTGPLYPLYASAMYVATDGIEAILLAHFVLACTCAAFYIAAQVRSLFS